MTLKVDEMYTSTGAWIAFGLTLATLPICVYPIVTTIRHALLTNTPLSRRKIGLRAFAQSWVWVAMTLSHCCLALYTFFSATELACENNVTYGDFDYGWEHLRPNCVRYVLLLAATVIESLTAPVYPISMMLVYMQLLPRSKRKRVRKLVKTLVAFQALLSIVLCPITLIDWAEIWTNDPTVLELSYHTTDTLHTVFQIWFAHMIACGLVSLLLSARLMPHLKVKSFKSPPPAARNHSAGSTRAAAADERSLPLMNRFPSPFRHYRMSNASTASKTAAHHMQVLVRWLQICIASVFALLVANIGAVIVGLEPTVLSTTIGWVSCHCISFALYMATSFVKRAVLARRMVPQSMAGTLAESGWSGADEEGEAEDVRTS